MRIGIPRQTEKWEFGGQLRCAGGQTPCPPRLRGGPKVAHTGGGGRGRLRRPPCGQIPICRTTKRYRAGQVRNDNRPGPSRLGRPPCGQIPTCRNAAFCQKIIYGNYITTFSKLQRLSGQVLGGIGIIRKKIPIPAKFVFTFRSTCGKMYVVEIGILPTNHRMIL